MNFDFLSMMKNGMKLLKFLEQDAHENGSNKRNIHKIVREDISVGLEEQINVAAEAVQEYVHQDYWDSKNVRIVHLMGYESCVDLVMDVLVIVAQLKEPVKVQEVVGRIAPLLRYEDLFDGIRTAAELLGVMQGELFTLIPPSIGKGGVMWLKNNIVLEKGTYAYIDGCEYLMPMLIKPLHIHANNQSGHVSFNSSVLLGKTKHHMEEVCLDVINIQNSVPLCLDHTTLEYEEEPKKDDLDAEQLSQFNIMKTKSRKVYETLLDQGNKYYLLTAYDGRGRLYSLGYDVTYQSSQYKRALVLIDKEEVIHGD